MNNKYVFESKGSNLMFVIAKHNSSRKDGELSFSSLLAIITKIVSESDSSFTFHLTPKEPEETVFHYSQNKKRILKKETLKKLSASIKQLSLLIKLLFVTVLRTLTRNKTPISVLFSKKYRLLLYSFFSFFYVHKFIIFFLFLSNFR